MMSVELHSHFTQLVGNNGQDVRKRHADTMERIDGLKTSFMQQLDTRFQEMMARLPSPPVAAPQPLAPQPAAGQPAAPQPVQHRRARCVPRNGPHATAGVAILDEPTADYYGADDYADKNEVSDEVLQPPLGRPHANHPHARRHQRPLVCDDDHIAKLKLNIPPFERRYNPDAYLSWELEVEQHFACLAYPEDKRVAAATCEFTSFASIWWSEYCRAHFTNPPTTWDALKRAMHTRFVPPYYQRDLLKVSLFRTRQKFSSGILSGITNWHDSL
jgi:hypothetical protein